MYVTRQVHAKVNDVTTQIATYWGHLRLPELGEEAWNIFSLTAPRENHPCWHLGFRHWSSNKSLLLLFKTSMLLQKSWETNPVTLQVPGMRLRICVWSLCGLLEKKWVSLTFPAPTAADSPPSLFKGPAPALLLLHAASFAHALSSPGDYIEPFLIISPLQDPWCNHTCHVRWHSQVLVLLVGICLF